MREVGLGHETVIPLIYFINLTDAPIPISSVRTHLNEFPPCTLSAQMVEWACRPRGGLSLARLTTSHRFQERLPHARSGQAAGKVSMM